MAMPEMDAVKDAALKYDKPTLARLAQSGQLSPTLAVMAGMMRDRIVQSEMKPPTPPTVAEEVMQPMNQRMGLAAAAQPQAPQQPQGQGLNQVPVPQQMFERQGMASGGIVAFQAGGGARGKLDPRVSALLQQNPGMTVPQAVKLLSRIGPGAIFSAGLGVGSLATDALMATDKGVGQAAAMGSGYDYSPEEMAGGRPNIPVESVGTREQGPGFTDYLRAVGLAPKEQVMDPATGKFVDVPPKPIFESATPGLAGVKDQTDVEKRLAEAEAGRGPDVERNSERAEVAEARRQDLLKQAAEDQAKKAEAKPKPTVAKPAAEEGEDKKPKTYDDYLKEVTNRMGASTVGKGMREEIEKDKAARKEAKQEAMWISLVEAGLGIAGGDSPYAMVNIGKGATNALKSYADRLREQKKLDREDRRILLDLEKAERAEQRDNYKLAAEMREKALDRMSAEKRSQISADATTFAAQLNADVAKQAYSMMKPSTEATIRNNAVANAEAKLFMDDKFREAQKRKDQAGMLQRRNELFLEELRKLTPSGGASLGTSGLMLDYSALTGMK